jgi:hypothetical protein
MKICADLKSVMRQQHETRLALGHIVRNIPWSAREGNEIKCLSPEDRF